MKERGDVTVCVYAICKNEENKSSWIEFKEQKSIFDEFCSDYPAQ